MQEKKYEKEHSFKFMPVIFILQLYETNCI